MRTNSHMEYQCRFNLHNGYLPWFISKHIDIKTSCFLFPRDRNRNSLHHVVQWLCILIQQESWKLVNTFMRDWSFRCQFLTDLFLPLGSHWTVGIRLFDLVWHHCRTIRTRRWKSIHLDWFSQQHNCNRQISRIYKNREWRKNVTHQNNSLLFHRVSFIIQIKQFMETDSPTLIHRKPNRNMRCDSISRWIGGITLKLLFEL